MNPPLVYCIILNRNGKELLAETLLSVGAMKYPSVKIIVVDNGSDDGSQAMVRKEFPGAELMENGRNLGFGPGNNVGMQRALDAGAEWLILLNNDIAVDPLMLDELMNVALSDQAIGALSPKIYYFTEPETLW